MAQTWTCTTWDGKGLPCGMDPTYNVSGVTFFKATGPVTSVQAGAALGVTSDLASYVIGATIIARKSNSALSTYRHEVIVDETFSTGSLKILTIRCSTGVRLSSAVNLSGETLYLARWERE